jgi:tetratricopeptide (TPR) repeat protein
MYQVLLLVLLLPMGLQEEDPDAQYREDFTQYEEIAAIADHAERATQFMDWVDVGFDDRLLGAVEGGIQTSLEGLVAAADLDALYPLADRWDEQTGALTGAAQSLQSAAAAVDHENSVKYGEIIYAANPVVEIARFLAVSYMALGNNDEYLAYANVTIDAQGVAEAFDFAYSIYQQEQIGSNWDEAAEWATRIKALPSAPNGVTAAEWRDMGIDFQRTIARAEFEGGRWEAAIREYQALAGLDRDQRAISNFFMGRCYFELGGPVNVNLAMERFADAAVLNDETYSEPSRTMVDEIYSLNTEGDLSLLDEVVLVPARARMQ